MLNAILALLLFQSVNAEYKSIFPDPPVDPPAIDYCSLEVVTCEETIEGIIDRVCEENSFSQCDKLKRIAFCESSNDPKAKNPKSSATGLFQILDMHGLSISERQDPEIATQWAIDNFKEGKPWASSQKCWR